MAIFIKHSTQEILITFVGAKTGKKFTVTVWFARNGEKKLYLLPVGGTRSKWYTNVLKNPMLELEASGEHAILEARPTQDRRMIEEIMQKLEWTPSFRDTFGSFLLSISFLSIFIFPSSP